MSNMSIRIARRIMRLSLMCLAVVAVQAGEITDSPKGDTGRLVLDGASARIRAERMEFDKESKAVHGSMRPADSVEWDFRVDRPGWYQVIVHYALASDSLKGAGSWKAEVGDQTRLGPIHATGAGDRYLPQVLFDPIELDTGKQQLKLSIRSGGAGLTELKIRKVEIVRAREPGRQ